MILHICEFTSDFFIHINEEPKKYCKLANDFFDSCKRKKERNYIAHLQTHKRFAFNSICEDKQQYCTFKSQQVVFSTRKGERKK